MRRLVLTVLLCLVSACATPERLDPETTPPEVLYNHAADLLIKQREYTKAIEAFDEIDRYYPYSRWALKAQIMLAFTNYVKKEYDDAEIVLDHFIRLYPGNKYAPYAYYLKAMCSYAQLSDPKRDQKKTQNALQALQEVVSRFPRTDYAADAEKKLNLAYDYLAAKELNVGKFYQKNNEHAAALNRFFTVVRDYPATRSVQEALFRLTETYLILGLDEEAQKSAAVLGYNYPDSRWYKKAYELMKEYAPETIKG